MELLYAHSRTCVWRLTRRLEGHTCEPYGERGWEREWASNPHTTAYPQSHHICAEGYRSNPDPPRRQPFFETTVSWLIKHAPNCLDIGTDAARHALAGFKGRLRPVNELVSDASYEHFGISGVHGDLKDARSPPILPDDFATAMSKKVLTNGADRAVVTDLQRKVATIVLRGVGSLDFSSLGWDANAAQQLARALPWCGRLHTLNVSLNRLGAEGAKHVAEKLKDNKTLTSVQCAPPSNLPS